MSSGEQPLKKKAKWQHKQMMNNMNLNSVRRIWSRPYLCVYGRMGFSHRKLLKTTRTMSTMKDEQDEQDERGEYDGDIWRFIRPGRNNGKEICHTVTILGGVHGNELVGIQVVRKLVEKLQSGALYVDNPNAELIVAIGNPLAVEKNARGSEAGQDLNRSFSCDLLESFNEQCSSYEANRALVLAPLLRRTDVLVDLHATNKPSEPFIRIAGRCTKRHMDIASWFVNLPGSEETDKGRTKLLVDPNHVIGSRMSTTDEFVNSFGGFGICVETGEATDKRALKGVYRRVLQMLDAEVGLRRSGTKRPLVGFPAITPGEQVGRSYGESKILLNCSFEGEVVEDGEVESLLRVMSQNRQAPLPRTCSSKAFTEERDVYWNAAARTFETSEGKVSAGVGFSPSIYSRLFAPYILMSSHMYTDSGFEWAPGVGTENWQHVKAGQEIGRTLQQDSEELWLESHVAPEDSCILFPKVSHLWAPFRPLYYLASPRASIDSTWMNPKSLPSMFIPKEAPPGSFVPIESFRASHDRVEQYNRDHFFAGLHGDRAQWRKGSRDRWTFINPNLQETIHSSPGVLPTKRMSMEHAQRSSGSTGFNIPQAIQSAFKFLQNWKNNPTLSVHARSVIYQGAPNEQPVIVYPSVVHVSGEHFCHGVAPFSSPRLSLPFKVHQFKKDSLLFLGIRIRHDEEIEAARSHLQDDANPPQLFDIEQDGKRTLLFECRMEGDSYMLCDRSETEPQVDCIRVIGPVKDDVGITYTRVANILSIFSCLTKAPALVEFHPAFDSTRGELVSSFGYKRPSPYNIPALRGSP